MGFSIFNANSPQSRSSMAIRDTTAIYIVPTWLGPCRQRAAVFQNDKSKTKYCMPETCQKKADLSDSSTTRDEQ